MTDDDWDVELGRSRWKFVGRIPASVKILMYSTCASILSLVGFSFSALAWGSEAQTDVFAFPLRLRLFFWRSVVYVPRWADRAFTAGFVIILILFVLVGAATWLHRGELRRVQ
jgi:hypothetical protein